MYAFTITNVYTFYLKNHIQFIILCTYHSEYDTYLIINYILMIILMIIMMILLLYCINFIIILFLFIITIFITYNVIICQ
jgi:hypothetical protein